MNPVEFANAAFGWKAFDYQQEPLKAAQIKHVRLIMACGRQVGKIGKMGVPNPSKSL